jgi:hypothetical protein
MAGEYLNPAVDDTDGDPSAIEDAMVTHLQTRIAGWEAQDGTPERYILEAVSIEQAETRDAANGRGQTYEKIARWFGETAFELAPLDPAAATAAATVTAVNNAGYTVEAGMEITVAGLAGERVGFTVVSNVVIPPGSSATSAGAVALIATVEGADSNGVQADAQVEDLGFDWILSVVLTAPSTGGSDGETDAEYLDRFVRRQRLSSTHLITPSDFEAYAPDWVDPVYGSPVDRALALDLYNPADGTYTNQGMVTVVPISDTGTALSAPIMAALKADMQDKVLAGMVVNVIAPTYTAIDVTFTFTTQTDYVPADVKTAAEAAVADVLSPANWGRPAPGENVWENEPVVDIGTIEGVIKNTPGVRRVTAITVEGGTTDVTMTGTPALPTAGTIVGTAV